MTTFESKEQLIERRGEAADGMGGGRGGGGLPCHSFGLKKVGNWVKWERGTWDRELISVGVQVHHCGHNGSIEDGVE
jgi:hypothetical protein